MALMVLCETQAEERTWTHQSGRTIAAEYVSTTLSDEVVLKKSDGTEIKLPLAELSPEDIDYVTLRHPPKLKIDFSDSSKMDTLDSSDRWPDNPQVFEEVVQFKVRIKQEGSKNYHFPLNVEYYAVAYQYQDHDKYCLLMKGNKDFELNDKNHHMVEISSPRLKLPLEFTLSVNHFGRKYSNYLVLVRDQRGEIIAHECSREWLYRYREKLAKLPVGAFFDDVCTRRHASGPKPNY